MAPSLESTEGIVKVVYIEVRARKNLKRGMGSGGGGGVWGGGRDSTLKKEQISSTYNSNNDNGYFRLPILDVLKVLTRMH